MNKYPLLFEPITIAGKTLKNRAIMGSMHTGLEESRNGFDRLAEFYRERAAGETALIVTGGISPNRRGRLAPMGLKLSKRREAEKHKVITKAVHKEGGLICMQILHAGRYGYHPFNVGPSAIKSPITPFKPKALSQKGVEKTIQDFIRCAELAKEAGYDGVEVMGSEGYLINQFIVSHTNKRTDRWGGSYENRIQFPIEIVKGIREKVGDDFIIIYRLSMIDLIPDGSSWEEVVQLAKEIERAGASVINTGIGWHEARIPTIATSVPRKSFSWVTEKLKGEVKIPLITSNRINMPEVAEEVLRSGSADLVSMARPFLADSEIMIKSKENRADEINTCIACNQACLDHIFSKKVASCLLNPRACRETELKSTPSVNKKKIGIIGAGPAGMACAIKAAERGHSVHLYDKADEVGGQFNLAKTIPGKEEFHEAIRYYKRQIELTGVNLHLKTLVDLEMIKSESFDDVIFATGVSPRKIDLPGIESSKVISYFDLLSNQKKLNGNLAIIGAGGIGFDVCEYITGHKTEINEFFDFWGVDKEYSRRGGLKKPDKQIDESRKVYLLQRSKGKVGAGLGKTTGWIHRTELKKRGVQMLSGVNYKSIVEKGLKIEINGSEQLLEVDHVVICAGQVSKNSLYQQSVEAGLNSHNIGGSFKAGELDAKVAIEMGYTLGLEI